ncbi:SBBP repeat-containing protein [bacterium]|nr:SBBP repeat-containing protein [bacterium]
MNKQIISIGLIVFMILEVHLTTRALAFDQDETVVLYDPARFSTYWGGSTNDAISSVIHGNNSEIIIAGYTESDDISIKEAFQDKKNGGWDGFVGLLNQNAEPIWSTYLGGSEEDRINDCAIDSQQNIYVVGTTFSLDFPIKDALKHENKGEANKKIQSPGLDMNWEKKEIFGEAFLAKFSSTGNLIWSTYFGGSNYDEGYHIEVDLKDHIYIVGTTKSEDLITKNANQPHFNDNLENPTKFQGVNYYGDIFIAQFTNTGNLIWSTYFGGEGMDKLNDVALNHQNQLFICGSTASKQFPTIPANHNTFQGGVYDGYYATFNEDGKLIRSRYLGSKTWDDALSLTFDSADNLYIAGYADKSMIVSKTEKQFNTYRFCVGTVQEAAADTYLASFDPHGYYKSIDFFSVESYFSGSKNTPDHVIWTPENRIVIVMSGAGGSSYLYFYDIQKKEVLSKYDTHGYVNSIGIDSNGLLLTAGETRNLNFPIKNAYQSKHTFKKYNGTGFITCIEPHYPTFKVLPPIQQSIKIESGKKKELLLQIQNLFSSKIQGTWKVKDSCIQVHAPETVAIEKDQILPTQFKIQLQSLISIKQNIQIQFTGTTSDGISTSAIIPINVDVEGPLELQRIPQETIQLNPLQQTEFCLVLKNQTQEKLEILLSCSEFWIYITTENPMMLDKERTDVLKVLIYPFFLKPGTYATQLTLTNQLPSFSNADTEIPVNIIVKPLSFWLKLRWYLRYPWEKMRQKIKQKGGS